MKKILFLDIDGVLNTGRGIKKMSEIHAPKDSFGYDFDPDAVANLRRIIEATGAEIVISSSWKGYGLDGLHELWETRNLPGKVIDYTPEVVTDEMIRHANLEEVDMTACRGEEIRQWLLAHQHSVSHYAILDDLDDMQPDQMPHFVQTNYEVGISKEDADRVMRENANRALENGEMSLSEEWVVNPDTGEVVPASTLETPADAELQEKEKKGEGESPVQQQDNNINRVNVEGSRGKEGTQTFSQLAKSKKHRKEITQMIKNKWPEAPNALVELEGFLRDKGIEVDAIGTTDEDVQAWINHVECKTK